MLFFLRKYFFYGFPWKRLFPLFILGLIDGVSFLLAFYFKNVFPSLPRKLGISEGSYSTLQTVYGIFSLLTYIPGGILADRMSNKKLINFSLVLTLLGGILFVFSFFLNPDNFQNSTSPITETSEEGRFFLLVIIHAIWGISTSGLLWASLWKFVSLCGNENEQGKVNAIEGAMVGLVGFLMVFFGNIILEISKGWAGWSSDGGPKGKEYDFLPFFNFSDKTLGGFLIFISFPIMIGFISLWLSVKYIQDDTQKLKKLTASFRLRDLGVVVRNKNLWLASLVVLAVYTYQSGLSIFGYYLQNSLFYKGGVLTPFIIFLVLASRAYLLRTIFSPSAGKIADKYKKYLLTLSILLTILFGLGILAVLLPGIHSDKSIVDIQGLDISKARAIFIQVTAILIDLIIAAICWCSVTIRWATITEIKMKKEYYGSAVGLMSLIAFSTDIWFWLIASVIQKNHEVPIKKVATLWGNQLIFLVMSSIGLFGALAGFYLHFKLKRGKNNEK